MLCGNAAVGATRIVPIADEQDAVPGVMTGRGVVRAGLDHGPVVVAVALGAVADPQSVANSLEGDAVQSVGVPAANFSAMSRAQIAALKAEIGRLDPGRMWIMVVAPRSSTRWGPGRRGARATSFPMSLPRFEFR